MGDKAGEVDNGELVLGVMHIQANRSSDLEDIKERARALMQEKGMDIVIQVEGIGENGCWCGGAKDVSLRRYS
jgi:zinc transporter 5/7